MNDNIQDQELMQQIEREVRMREGATKLLAACTQREQALEASKSLLTCNARILAMLSQLQKMRKAQILQSAGHRSSEGPLPCAGKVAVSDLRIPLMWKDSEYFKNKGEIEVSKQGYTVREDSRCGLFPELQRCTVFCLLHCGTEIKDTDLVTVDRTLTDICFEDAIIFNNVGPEFELHVELYSSCVVEDYYPRPARPRRGSLFSGTLGSSSGKKIRAAFESATLCGYISTGGGDLRPEDIPPPVFPELSSLGPKFNLLAHTTLTIKHVQEGFKTHDLTLSTTEESPFWLPLYGNMCCRLVAQPLCMTQSVLSGPVTVKLENDDLWGNFHGVLRTQTLFCYESQKDSEFGKKPLLMIPIHKDTVVDVSMADPARYHCVHIRTQHQGQNVTHLLSTYSHEDSQRWKEALQQHAYNMREWKQCCDYLMKIEVPVPRKSSTVKQGSLFHEIVTPASPQKGSLVPDVSIEIRSLLSSYYRESY